MKTSLSKTHKTRIFPKGLVHGFDEKFEILLTFRFTQKTPKKVFGDVLVRKQAFLDNKRHGFKKQNGKLAFFQRG